MRTKSSWRDHVLVHPLLTQVPAIRRAELKSLAEDIRQHGIRVPVVFTDCGGDLRLIDGCNRLTAAETVFGPVRQPSRGKLVAGEHAIPAVIITGDPARAIISYNLLRRQLTTAQKRELLKTLLAENPRLSDRAVAAVAGVDHKTVAAVRRAGAGVGEGGEIPHPTLPKSKNRDLALLQEAVRFAKLSGTALSDAVHDDVCQLESIRWKEIAEWRRLELAKRLRRLADQIESMSTLEAPAAGVAGACL